MAFSPEMVMAAVTCSPREQRAAGTTKDTPVPQADIHPTASVRAPVRRPRRVPPARPARPAAAMTVPPGSTSRRPGRSPAPRARPDNIKEAPASKVAPIARPANIKAAQARQAAACGATTHLSPLNCPIFPTARNFAHSRRLLTHWIRGAGWAQRGGDVPSISRPIQLHRMSGRPLPRLR